MLNLIGRSHLREVSMQVLRERLCYKPSVYKQHYDKCEVLFIHIPKCAGTSISRTLYGNNPWHWTAGDLRKINRKKYDSYFKFSIVRNPWDRLYSAYNYISVDVRRYRSSPLEIFLKYPDFESFVMEGVTEDVANRHYFLGKQINYLLTSSGVLDRSIRVGKLENIHDFLGGIADSVPSLRVVPHLNASEKKKNFSEDYSDEMVSRVRELFYEDVDAFGYNYSS